MTFNRFPLKPSPPLFMSQQLNMNFSVFKKKPQDQPVAGELFPSNTFYRQALPTSAVGATLPGSRATLVFLSSDAFFRFSFFHWRKDPDQTFPDFQVERMTTTCRIVLIKQPRQRVRNSEAQAYAPDPIANGLFLTGSRLSL